MVHPILCCEEYICRALGTVKTDKRRCPPCVYWVCTLSINRSLWYRALVGLSVVRHYWIFHQVVRDWAKKGQKGFRKRCASTWYWCRNSSLEYACFWLFVFRRPPSSEQACGHHSSTFPRKVQKKKNPNGSLQWRECPSQVTDILRACAGRREHLNLLFARAVPV